MPARPRVSKRGSRGLPQRCFRACARAQPGQVPNIAGGARALGPPPSPPAHHSPPSLAFRARLLNSHSQAFLFLGLTSPRAAERPHPESPAGSRTPRIPSRTLLCPQTCCFLASSFLCMIHTRLPVTRASSSGVSLGLAFPLNAQSPPRLPSRTAGMPAASCLRLLCPGFCSRTVVIPLPFPHARRPASGLLCPVLECSAASRQLSRVPSSLPLSHRVPNSSQIAEGPVSASPHAPRPTPLLFLLLLPQDRLGAW